MQSVRPSARARSCTGACARTRTRMQNARTHARARARTHTGTLFTCTHKRAHATHPPSPSPPSTSYPSLPIRGRRLRPSESAHLDITGRRPPAGFRPPAFGRRPFGAGASPALLPRSRRRVVASRRRRSVTSQLSARACAAAAALWPVLRNEASSRPLARATLTTCIWWLRPRSWMLRCVCVCV